jgi:hypothetical protein
MLDPSEIAAMAEWCLENITRFNAWSVIDLMRNPRQYREEYDAWADWQRDTDPYR